MKIIEWLEKEYPKGIELNYVDYRDYIEDAKKREELLQNPDDAYEILNCYDWLADEQSNSINEIERQYLNENPELTEEERDKFQEWCIEHDTSDVISELIKNCPSEYMYYDTGVFIPEFTDEKEFEKTLKIIAKTLKIDLQKHFEALRLMLSQASYGGQLVILFENKIANFIQDTKYIRFNDKAEVCIMDRTNGSGDSVKLNEPLLFEFNRKNLHLDKGDNGYSYSDDVCGLVGNIMNDGVLTNKKSGKVIKTKTNEEREAQRKREAGFIAKWNNGRGSCSFGDMNIKRHKSTPYRNDYPCGNKCESCGTFWID